MTIFRPGTNKVWAAFASVYLVATLGVAACWLFTETGPARGLIELQARCLDGAWSSTLTTLGMIVCWMAMTLSLALVKIVAEAATGKKLSGPKP